MLQTYTNTEFGEIRSEDELLEKAYLIVQKRLAEREQRLHQSEQKTAALEVALNESLEYYTVMRYSQVYHKNWSMSRRQEIGKMLSKYCRLCGITIHKCYTGDDRFDVTNSYPLSVWEYFATHGRL